MSDAIGNPQTILVLGGSSEIGLAITAKLASRTRSIALVGRSQEKLEQSATHLRSKGAPEISTVIADAADASTAADAVEAGLKALGGSVDLVLVAVGLLGDQEHDENDAGAAAELVAVNYAWPSAALSALRPSLITQGHGLVVHLSSVAAVRVRRANYLYGASKAGMDDFALGFGDGLDGSGVKVMTIRPGFVSTKMTAGRKAGPFSTTADKVAADVVAALSSSPRILYSPGILRYIFGILRHLPLSLWRKIPG